MTNDEIAEAIADALFVNGLGEQADRLVMKKRDQAQARQRRVGGSLFS